MRRNLLLAAALALAGMFLTVRYAGAQQARHATRITVLNEGTLQAVNQLTLKVRLTTDAGAPIDHAPLDLFLTNDFKRTDSSDSNGIATFDLRFDLSAGTYNLVLTYRGSQANQPASLTVPLTVGGASNTRLVIEPLKSVTAGSNAVVTARLSKDDGAPLPNQRIWLSIDGEKVASALTDANGMAFIRTGTDISTGTHKLVASFDGTRDYAQASATMSLGVTSLFIELHVIPELEGVRFAVDNREFVSGPDGVARIQVNSPGTYQVQLLGFEPTDEIRAEFYSWGDRTSSLYHDVKVPMGNPLKASFRVSHLVSQSFVDLGGNVVDPSRVTSLTFKRSDGAVFTFKDYQPRWLEANYIVRRLDGLVASPFQYALMSVVVNGTNVVSAQQQRYYVHPNDEWVLQLLLFSAHFKAHDLLYGYPLGSSIVLEYPDGYQLTAKLNEKSETTVLSLPRGAYKVTVHSRLGFAPTASLAMSRNQEVDLPIISYLDIFTMAVVALALGPGILLVGQPRLRRFLWERSFGIWRRRRHAGVA